MLIVVGTIRLPAEKLDQARDAMRKMIEASRAEEGCADYAYAEDVLDPGLVHIKELWRDQQALDCHFASDHIAAWRKSWSTLGIGDRHLMVYDVRTPRAT